MSQDRPRYLSYLIRMWQVKARRGWQWRASLESPGNGERRAFPSLDRLIAYLRAQTDHQGLDGEVESNFKDARRKKMNRATVSIIVFGIYAMMAGLGFMFIPNIMLPLFGLPETNEVWIRVVGLLAFFVGGYYLVAARNNLIPFYRATVLFRPPFAVGLFLLVLLDFSKPGLAIIGVFDILGAAWTWWALRSESYLKGLTPQATGR